MVRLEQTPFSEVGLTSEWRDRAIPTFGGRLGPLWCVGMVAAALFLCSCGRERDMCQSTPSSQQERCGFCFALKVL